LFCTAVEDEARQNRVIPQDLLLQGKEILDPLLEPMGFHFQVEQVGRGSGGAFAVGSYSNGTWSLELHVRRALGIVNYKVGQASLEHRVYMKALGVQRQAAYPGFSDDPLDGFRHLRSDLERFATAFLRRENSEEFRQMTLLLKQNPNLFKRLP
jgi:hypothetical protein